MNLSQEILNNVFDLGKALTPIEDVAILLDLNQDLVKSEMLLSDSELYKYYHKGRAETELDVRKFEINMAASGSPMAIQHVNSYITNLNVKNQD